MNDQLAELYGNRVRVRVCGLCWDEGKLLLINHRLVTETRFWSPPGGGVEFEERLESALEREFLEETGLQIQAGNFLFGCEFIHAPLHAIELFFSVTRTGGKLVAGHDPELQLIREASFIGYDDILRMPQGETHGVFRLAPTREDLDQLSGFYRI